jgi:hypothetical protein
MTKWNQNILAATIAAALLLFAGCGRKTRIWTRAGGDPCSFLTKEEVSKAMSQEIGDPVPHEFYADNEQGRKQIESLADRGLQWQKTCEYNGLQQNKMLDFAEVIVYKFVDEKQAGAFYETVAGAEARKAGSWRDLEYDSADKAAALHGVNGSDLWLLNRDMVFTIGLARGENNEGYLTWEPLDKLAALAVTRLP